MTKNKNFKRKLTTASVARLVNAFAAMKSLTGNKKKKKKKRKNKIGRVTGASMGPVATINTAPVAIGNSVRGSKAVSRRTGDGVIVSGRDFMFNPVGTASTITTWCMVGGTPLTPACFVDAGIRAYLQIYQKYRWHSVTVHYITSSPTSQPGDVMFYHGKNRDSVFLNQTSQNLLPFVISDPSTVIGPQWTNHSAVFHVEGTWKSTDYGMDDALNNYADGEVFLLSKTNETSSSGYVLFDYVVEFAEMQVSPRLLTLPMGRIQYSQFSFGTSGAKTQGNTGIFVVNGNNLTGNASALPTGWTVGDLYKVIIDNTNSTYTTGTSANLLENSVGGTAATVTLSDGFTCYANAISSTQFILCPNATSAFGDNAFGFGASLTYNVVVQAWFSLVGTMGTVNWAPNY
jgi:hypothetical protein